MTSELWNDLHGFEKVKVVLATRISNSERNRRNCIGRLKGENVQRYTQRIGFQDPRSYVRNMHDNPLLIDIDLDD